MSDADRPAPTAAHGVRPQGVRLHGEVSHAACSGADGARQRRGAPVSA
ncbi:hypothetical protein [Streptomyces sp. BBFR102]